MSEFKIEREEDDKKGRYVIRTEQGEAELGYNISSPTLRIADHTSVPDGLRGTGCGHLMAEKFVQDALAEGWKIIPLCPFVNAERRKHPEWAEAFQV